MAVDTTVPVTGVSTAIDGAPQRVIRTEVIENLERTGVLKLPRAAVNALRFRRLTDTSLPDLLREGWSMKQNQDLTWSQVAMAANAAMLTRASMVEGRLEVGILPTGQCVGVVDDLPTCDDLISRIVAEAAARLESVCG